MTLKKKDRRKLKAAHRLLENPGLTIKITNFLGTPIEKSIALLPDGGRERIFTATEEALRKAADIALFTLEDAPGKAQENLWHKLSVVVTGGAGGALGFTAVLAELPIATTLMLRSIADIARSHGESITDPNTKMACLEVFALGGPSASDDASESAYFTVRMALAQQVSAASSFLAKEAATQSLSKESAPQLIRLLSAIAQRLGVQMSQKAAAQLVPVIGAVGGAMLNWLFMQHFQSMAQGHFTIRKLERKYGKDLIRQEYNALSDAASAPGTH